MDINLLRSIATFILLVGFIGLCVLLVYSAKHKRGFEDAANLPFIDDDNASKKSND